MLLATLVVSAGVTVASTPVASAASGETLLCKDYGFDCAGGGYSGQSTWGYPVDSTGHNCTNYAAYRLAQNGAYNPGNLGNAMDWDDNARAKGFSVNGTPTLGAIAQWEANTGHAGSYGHVAYVEKVGSDHIIITEDNYGLGHTAKYKIMEGSAAWPSNFLHIKDLGGSSSGPGMERVKTATFRGNDKLVTGQEMHVGQYILSGNARYVLIMQTDGNLVMYHKGRALWDSGTAGHPRAWLTVQPDGNVVIYDGNRKALWHAHTANTDVNRLVMQSDGNLVAYTDTREAKWHTWTGGQPRYDYRDTDRLNAGQKLHEGQYIRSNDKRFALLMQPDGNLVLYGPGYYVLWHARTSGHSGAYLAVQGDGNVVVYDEGRALWYTGTRSADRLIVQGDGNLVAYAGGTAVWYTNTDGII